MSRAASIAPAPAAPGVRPRRLPARNHQNPRGTGQFVLWRLGHEDAVLYCPDLDLQLVDQDAWLAGTSLSPLLERPGGWRAASLAAGSRRRQSALPDSRASGSGGGSGSGMVTAGTEA